MRSGFFSLILFLLFSGCKTPNIPDKKLPTPSPVKVSYETLDDTLRVHIQNRVKSPVHIKVDAVDKIFDQKLKAFKPIVLQAEKDTLLLVKVAAGDVVPELEFQAGFGDPQKKITHPKVALPIPENKAVRIIQGQNGSYSHNKDSSRFAIDFELKVGDTVFAAYEGYAIEVIEGYKFGGKDIRWLDFGNHIFIYNPETGLFFQYSHLKHNGALIEQGDWVKQGQPIGLSGMTGYTDIPHLHFNVLAPDPVEIRLNSVPVDFMEGYPGKDLQKNVVIKR